MILTGDEAIIKSPEDTESELWFHRLPQGFSLRPFCPGQAPTRAWIPGLGRAAFPGIFAQLSCLP